MRFVVIEIPDNEEADAFVKAVDDGLLMYAVRQQDTNEFEMKFVNNATVPQVYAVPTMFCECAVNYSQARSKKYGWYVCVKCSKPRKGSMQHPFNLRETHKPVTERVYYMGFRSDRQGWRIPKAHP